MDHIDAKILDILHEDASLSTHKISKKTAIPQTTILNRIKKLKKSGIVRKFTVDIDHKQVGKKLKVLIFAKVDKKITAKDYGGVGKIEKTLVKHDFVLNVKRLMGQYDFVIEGIFADVDELDAVLHKYVRSVPAISETESVVVLNEWS